jgi:predicted PurR-regulated permease PerM
MFSFIVFVLAGVPNPLTLAVYVGVADLVPMFGGMLGMIPAVLIALTISPIKALIVLVGFTLYQNLENHFIVPRVYSRTMRISSLVALVALLIGAKLLGMLGLLLALPLVAALPVILDAAGIHLKTEGGRPQPVADAADDVT